MPQCRMQQNKESAVSTPSAQPSRWSGSNLIPFSFHSLISFHMYRPCRSSRLLSLLCTIYHWFLREWQRWCRLYFISFTSIIPYISSPSIFFSFVYILISLLFLTNFFVGDNDMSHFISFTSIVPYIHRLVIAVIYIIARRHSGKSTVILCKIISGGIH